MLNRDDYSEYPKVVEQILPSYTVEKSDNKPYYNLDTGGITEAFDIQASGAIEAGIAKHWYPQYLATVIIAVDRDQTKAIVDSWKDLFDVQQEVSFFDTSGNMQMLVAAMSYGLEGEDYSSTKTIELLDLLNSKNRLKMNSFEAPITICYDYQAATLIKNNRNIEIIVPKEGTFTYEKGLLSNEELHFKGNIDKLLLESKLRLLDGQGDPYIYPDKSAYAPAIKVPDYKHFAKVTRDVSCLIERNVLNSKKIMSIDNREHLQFALVYIIIITVWIALILRRSGQNGVSYAAFFTGIILNIWTLVRLIKYQNESNLVLDRYLWYSFYIFLLTLPLLLLWMAWAIDKPEDEIFPPKWWRCIGVLIGILIIFVFTNDLHGLVFKLDLSKPDWAINYSYGFGYYMILIFSMINLLVVFTILLKKSIKNPRKKGIILPIAIFILYGIYNYKYIMRDPFVYETDLTIVTGIFTMLMFESCIRSGLIPVNMKHIDFFRHSPLKMQIINNDDEIVLSSATADPFNKDIFHEAIESLPMPILEEDDLLFTNPIPGGYVIWQENISKLYKLHKEIEESTQMLIEANAILAQEESLKRHINEKKAKKQLMEQLEIEISESITKMSTMIENLPYSEDQSSESTCIALLLCYIKRRCNLFFNEKEMYKIDVDILSIYIDELSEIAKYSKVDIVVVNNIEGKLSIRYATLFYDFFYEMVYLAVKTACTHTIGHLESKKEFVTMGFLIPKDMKTSVLESKLGASITEAKGVFIKKDLEDAIGISISFPRGGDPNDRVF